MKPFSEFRVSHFMKLSSLIFIGCATATVVTTESCQVPVVDTRQPICQTRCGLMYMGNTDESYAIPHAMDCYELQNLEWRLLSSFSKATDPAFHDNVSGMCRALAGVRMYTYAEARAFGDTGSGDRYLGISFCAIRSFKVGMPVNYSCMPTATIAHEIAHIIQGCVSPAPTDEWAPGGKEYGWQHSNWVRDGIMRAVDEASPFVTLPDGTQC